MVKTYKFNDTSLTKLKETLGDFKVTKISDIISFLNTEQISKDDDKIYINDNLTFDLKTINHENNINFDFDMALEIGSGYTFEIVNANATDNNIQYINFNKPVLNKGTIIINHLVCNNSQLTNEKKGVIQNNSIFYNSQSISSNVSIINNGEFVNCRTFYNNGTFINNSTFKHDDKQNIQTYNNKKFENNGTLSILNGEFIVAEKKEEIKEDEKTPDLLDDNLDTIQEKQETEKVAEVVAKSTVTQTTTEYQTIIDKDGTFKNKSTIEIGKGLIKSSGEFKNENGKITIEEGSLEIGDGILELSKSELNLNNGSVVLTKGLTDFKDESIFTINGGEFKMTSGIFNLYDNCKFIVNSGKISFNKSFNILGGQLSFIEGKFDTNNYKLNLSTSILDTENANVDQKLNFIIESETVENNVKSLIDDNYILKSELDKQLKDLTDSKTKEIESLKEEFVKKHEEKVSELQKQIKSREEEIQKLKEDVQNQKIQISNLETAQTVKQDKEVKEETKQETKEETVKETKTSKLSILPKTKSKETKQDKQTTQIVKSKTQTTPSIVSKVYELTFDYNEEKGQIIPIIKLTDKEVVEEDEEEIQKEAEEIVEDLLDESDESDSKFSRAIEKIKDKIRNQPTIKRATQFASAFMSLARMKVSANYVLKSLLDEECIAKVETIQKKHVKTYSKTINADDTKTITKVDKKDTKTQITKYEKPKTTTDVKSIITEVIDKFANEDDEKEDKTNDEESRMMDEEELEEQKKTREEISNKNVKIIKANKYDIPIKTPTESTANSKVVQETINKEKTSDKTETITKKRNRNMTTFQRMKTKPLSVNKTSTSTQTTQRTSSGPKRRYSNGDDSQIIDTSRFRGKRRFI